MNVVDGTHDVIFFSSWLMNTIAVVMRGAWLF